MHACFSILHMPLFDSMQRLERCCVVSHMTVWTATYTVSTLPDYDRHSRMIRGKASGEEPSREKSPLDLETLPFELKALEICLDEV